jgi:hypothetical protein
MPSSSADPRDPNKPDAPAPDSTPVPPTGNEKTTDADAASTTRRSPLFRELLPEEYGRDYVIGGAVPPKRR